MALDIVASSAQLAQSPDLVKVNEIKEEDWVFIRMPSGNFKLVELKSDTIVLMGKFGTFAAKHLYGMPFDVPYECIGKDMIRPAPYTSILDVIDIEFNPAANNQGIYDSPSAQKLSQTDIEDLKQSQATGEMDTRAVIENIVSNSSTYSQKTGFSKAKYIKRKESKFSKIFVPLRPSIQTVSEFYFERNPEKICGMRLDSLSQMLSFANIRSGGKYFVLDDTHGMVLAAIMERMGGNGVVVAVHESVNSPFDIVRYMNFEKVVQDTLHTIQWKTFLDESKQGHPNEPLTDSGNDVHPSRFDRKVYFKAQLRVIRSLCAEAAFDGLIVVGSTYRPFEVVESFGKYLAGSKPVVVYTEAVQPLLETYKSLRLNADYIKVEMSDIWTREYQSPAQSSSTHPHMSTTANSGFLLQAIKVINEEQVLAASDETEIKAVVAVGELKGSGIPETSSTETAVGEKRRLSTDDSDSVEVQKRQRSDSPEKSLDNAVDMEQ